MEIMGSHFAYLLFLLVLLNTQKVSQHQIRNHSFVLKVTLFGALFGSLFFKCQKLILVLDVFVLSKETEQNVNCMFNTPFLMS